MKMVRKDFLLEKDVKIGEKLASNRGKRKLVKGKSLEKRGGKNGGKKERLKRKKKSSIQVAARSSGQTPSRTLPSSLTSKLRNLPGIRIISSAGWCSTLSYLTVICQVYFLTHSRGVGG